MGVKSPRKYTEEFKLQAIDLARELGAREAARKLGVSDANIHNWKKKLGSSLRTAKEKF